MHRFRVARSEAAFEQFGSRDSHLDKLPGFGEFRLLEDPKLRITHFMLATLSGKTALC
jgi:heme-degrading monooxygenase HmoA